jgi:hypothetical protein
MLHLPLAPAISLLRAYRLAYASQRGTAVDRAHRGQAKIKARLTADIDPDEWDLPPKPKWMRWRNFRSPQSGLNHATGAAWRRLRLPIRLLEVRDGLTSCPSRGKGGRTSRRKAC